MFHAGRPVALVPVFSAILVVTIIIVEIVIVILIAVVIVVVMIDRGAPRGEAAARGVEAIHPRGSSHGDQVVIGNSFCEGVPA